MKRPLRKQSHGKLFVFLQAWGLTLVLLIFSIFTTPWILSRLHDPDLMPVRLVKVEGAVRHLNPKRLEEVVHKAVDGGFFFVTLAKVRAEVELLPWVDSASIRRTWPDTLLVKVVEQQPLARWGGDALVNLKGEIFRPKPLPVLSGLAVLEGEAQDSVFISREYQKMETLLGTVGLELHKVDVDARQAWLLWTRNGLVLNLGRKQLMPRLTRFVQLYPGLSGDNKARLKKVDLRYTNGFTASWEALPDVQTNGDDPAGKGKASRLAGI